MVVTSEQNTAPNGYGAAADPGATRTKLLGLWARFYGVGRFDGYGDVAAAVAAAAGGPCRYLALRMVRPAIRGGAIFLHASLSFVRGYL